MLYTLLTKNDIDAIEVILKEHGVVYQISVNEELIHTQNEQVKFTRHVGRSNALYNILIEKEEFQKISDSSRSKLEKYNIFPEMSDELFHADTHIIPSPFSNSDKQTLGFKIMGFCMAIMFITIGVIWVDQYMIKIYRSKSDKWDYRGEENQRLFQGYLFSEN